VIAVYSNVIQTNLTVTGATICQGSVNATIQVSASESGANYQAFFNNNSISDLIPGGGNISIPINTAGFSSGSNSVIIQVTKPSCGTLNLSNQAIVLVQPAPNAGITANGSLNLCPGDQVILSAPDDMTYQWSTGATSQNIVVNSAQTVTVTVTDLNNCSATSSPITTTMNEVPTAQISANGSLSICQGESVLLTASGGTTFLWSTGATTSSIAVSEAGTYEATVSNGTCSATSNSLVVQVLALPSIGATASQNAICPGESVTLNGTGGSSYTWNQGVVNGVAFAPSATTTYQVTGIGVNGCSNTASIQVVVNALPNAAITANGSLNLCPGDQVILSAPDDMTYQWSTGATSQNIVVNSAQTVTVTVTDLNNCSATSSPITTTMNEVPTAQISANGSLSICQGESVLLTASGGTTFLWSTGATTSSIAVSESGTYEAIVSNGTCSATSNSLVVQVLALPSIGATASQNAICPGESVTLNGTGGSSYTWNQGVVNGVAFAPSATTTYQVTGIGVNGCSNTASVQVVVNALPNASFNASSAQICPGSEHIQLTAQEINLATYNWLLNGTSFAADAGPTVSTNLTGIYTLEVTNDNGCVNSFDLTITSGELPIAVLSSSSTAICVGSTQTITANVLAGAQYTWLLDGNNVGGPSASNTFTATLPGSYQVVVTNLEGCENTSEALILESLSLPEVQITAENTTICSGQTTIITASELPDATYQWFLNGNPISGATNLTLHANQAGNYSVQVTTTCSNTSNVVQILTQPLPGNAGVIAGNNQLCAGQTQTYSISNVPNATSYLWSISPANAATISQNNGTSVVVNSTNMNFTLTVTPQNNCGNGSASQLSVNVSTGGICMNQVMFAANNTNTCINNQVIYTNFTSPNLVIGLNPVWSFGAGANPATANGSGPHTVTYTTAGLKTVILSYQDVFGTTVFSEVKTNYVNVSSGIQTPSIQGTNTILCNSDEEVYFVTPTAGSTYDWTVPSHAQIVSGQFTSSVTVNWNGQGGLITVIESGSNGCLGSPSSMTISISNPVSTGDISGPSLVACNSTAEQYSVVNTSGSTFFWSVPQGASILSGQGTNQISVNFAGNFGVVSVVETTSDNCSGDLVQLDVNCNLSLNDNKESFFKLFPNPTDGEFTIHTNLLNGESKLELFGLQGEIIFETYFTETISLNIEHLAKGFYMGRISQGGTSQLFKVVRN
jgi:hypothetical protein